MRPPITIAFLGATLLSLNACVRSAPAVVSHGFIKAKVDGVEYNYEHGASFNVVDGDQLLLVAHNAERLTSTSISTRKFNGSPGPIALDWSLRAQMAVSLNPADSYHANPSPSNGILTITRADLNHLSGRFQFEMTNQPGTTKTVEGSFDIRK